MIRSGFIGSLLVSSPKKYSSEKRFEILRKIWALWRISIIGTYWVMEFDHWVWLTKRDDYFWVVLTIFEGAIILWGTWANTGHWLKDAEDLKFTDVNKFGSFLRKLTHCKQRTLWSLFLRHTRLCVNFPIWWHLWMSNPWRF